MAMTLQDIRFIIEKFTGPIEESWLVAVSNNAQAEFALNINVPATVQVAINTSNLEYTLPLDLKIISRMWLQSDRDNGLDTEFKWPNRVYNGKLIFRQPYGQAETLNIDYFKHLKYFKNAEETIDLDDRFSPLYTSYAMREYFDQPAVKASVGDTQSRQEWEKNNLRYIAMQQQVLSYYALQQEPAVVEERW